MIQVFKRREEAPSSTNKYYIKTTHGGYNRCILIQSDGSVLPNCTGYAYGRFMECQLGVKSCKLSRGDAEVWYPYRFDGYERGQTAKLGAVICWSSTQSGGHVAIVEKINQDGSILTSNSAYGGSRFYMKTLTPPDYYMGSAYTFQGFIYNPTEFIDPDDPAFKNKNKRKFPWVLYARKFRKRSHFTND